MLIDLHNSVRKNKLKFDFNLFKYSQIHSQYMGDNSKLIHSDIKVLLKNYNLVGENIATAPDEETAFDMWMHSKGHRENILNEQFNRVGFGNWFDNLGINYYCVVFARLK